MSDKENKGPSDFDDFEDHQEHDEFFDEFDDDPTFIKKKTKEKVTTEPKSNDVDEFGFDEFEEENEFDEKPQKEDGSEEIEEEIIEDEEKEPMGDKGLFQYLKDNAVFLVVGGFFIITALTRLYSMYADTTPPVATSTQASQNLQFGGQTGKPTPAPVTSPAQPQATAPAATTVIVTPPPAVPAAAAVPTSTTTVTSTTAPAVSPDSNINVVATTVKEGKPFAATVPAPIPGAPTAVTLTTTTTAAPAPTTITPAATTTVTQQTVTAPKTATTPTSTMEVKEIPQAVVTTVTEKEEKPKATAFFASEKPAVSDKELKQLNDRLGDIEEQLREIKTLETKLTSLQTPVGGASSELSNIKNQLIQTNKIVTELSNQMKVQRQRQSEDIGSTITTTSVISRGEVFSAPEAVNTILVQAVIPGRAWLKDTKGKLLTVQLGDEIPGYGIVVSIDAHRAIVRTNERFEFRPL